MKSSSQAEQWSLLQNMMQYVFKSGLTFNGYRALFTKHLAAIYLVYPFIQCCWQSNIVCSGCDLNLLNGSLCGGLGDFVNVCSKQFFINSHRQEMKRNPTKDTWSIRATNAKMLEALCAQNLWYTEQIVLNEKSEKWIITITWHILLGNTASEDWTREYLSWTTASNSDLYKFNRNSYI